MFARTLSPGLTGAPCARMLAATADAACMFPAADEERASDLVPVWACRPDWATVQFPAAVQFAIPPSNPDASPVRRLTSPVLILATVIRSPPIAMSNGKSPADWVTTSGLFMFDPEFGLKLMFTNPANGTPMLVTLNACVGLVVSVNTSPTLIEA